MTDDTSWLISEAISRRRSIRNFAPDPISSVIVRDLVELACMAPAPHHSKPWRFVHVTSPGARESLADAMTEAWLADLADEGRPVVEVDRLIKRSRAQITEAPALVLACFALDESRTWPDERRRIAERDMFVQSLGAALQNILLAAVERGLAAYLKGAPLFCAPDIRGALGLPADWQPAFLVLIGYPEEGYAPGPHPPANIEDFMVER